MTLTFSAALPQRRFDVSFTLRHGETLAVLGPNGAGKSTLVNLIAGLLAPASGHAELEGEVLFGPGVSTPPHARNVALLAQDALLFPHLSVLENVAFGPRSSGASRRTARSTARTWLAEVGAAGFEHRRPGELSGGEAQRIAVARALAAEPRLLLLDEPMAALDVAVAPALRSMLRRVLAHRTAIIVTHDVLDAFSLADRVIVLDGGRIVDDGPTRSVLEQPRDPFTAGIAGLSVLHGIRTAEGLRTTDGDELRIAGGEDLEPGSACTLAIRPSSIRVSASRPAGAGNALRVGISDVEPRGDLVRLRAGALAADVTPATAADLDLGAGSTAWFAFRAEDAVLYSATR
ncbi:sulfate/molybdate ABC transporter ATP-binding protein [Subtercola boreus]|uniref:Molybdenum ABC transporter ATP-binding protein n=1 Tax=Subtercola boreus TaxID=120213 RepID=A0A3E0W631_9MICO|nr:ABC transporter ATP-binding protein [Subtercola boreus]RFA18219.1 molybdenum ABC transporter ATP-binding protein [Subtercola boreus]RFA18611.1 molybdenum ABC transporter ATP-binding protein [Subtercola boreus]RFA24688.1 molybdenum ABC transporter ATP-binding protein [Subtercola boreus]